MKDSFLFVGAEGIWSKLKVASSHLPKQLSAWRRRSLLTLVARAAYATGQDQAEIQARLRLGAIAGDAGDHGRAFDMFQLAEKAARRAGDDAFVVVALRNAADELRLQRDVAGAERLLLQALEVAAVPNTMLDLAKAKYMLAVVRHLLGNQADAERLLDEAEADFERKLTELGTTASRSVTEQLERQLRVVASLREKISH